MTGSDYRPRRFAVLIGVAVLIANCVGSMLGDSTEAQTHTTGSAVGVIEGAVIYESDRRRFWRYRRYYVADNETGHLAEAVVSLAEEPLTLRSTKATPRTWTVDQKDYRFIPETLAIRSGDQIKFGNSDAVLHDVTTRQREAISNEVFKQTDVSLQQGREALQTYNDAGGTERPVTLSCKFHSAMRGWIYVFDHGFFQVTDKTGTFRLENVPAGKHRLVMVHPAGNLRWEQIIEVNAGATQRVEIRVSPDNLLAP